ncbi:hypothetical protein ACTXL8_01055 [Glutamicibacter arilaitensis]
MIHVSSVILVAVFVDQLSIEQWHSAWIMKSLAGVLALGLFIGLFTADRKTRHVLRGPKA